MHLPKLLSLFAAVGILLSLFTGPYAAAGKLRILSLNAEWFPGRSPEPSPLAAEIHLCQVQHLLVEVNPDILLLQEVRCRDAIHELLAVLPDFQLHTMSEFGFQQELVVAARFEAVAAWTQRWAPHQEYFQPRGFALAVINLPGAQSLAVYTVHKKSNFQAEEEDEEEANAALRETSARQLVEHLQWLRGQDWNPPLAGIVVGGDFNTTYPRPLVRGERTFAILKEGGLLPLGLRGIDHFLACETGIQGKPQVFQGYRVSDHQPILLEIELETEVGWQRAEPLKMPGEGPWSCIAINVNQATEADLQLLPGIGSVLARRIVESRPFDTVDQLRRVRGIGPVRLRRIRDLIYVE